MKGMDFSSNPSEMSNLMDVNSVDAMSDWGYDSYPHEMEISITGLLVDAND